MAKISKKLKKAKKAATEEVYGLDLNNPDDRLEYEKLKLFDQLISYMAKQKISRKELSDIMRKSKQEITNRLNGRNLTISFLLKAVYALGIDAKIVFK